MKTISTWTVSLVLKRNGPWHLKLDPYMQSSSGKPSTFWNVFEYANADPNNSNPDLTSIQSSYWYQVNDPLPYYIGDVNEEATSPCKTGQKCTVTLSVPSGTQAGDVLLANIRNRRRCGNDCQGTHSAGFQLDAPAFFEYQRPGTVVSQFGALRCRQQGWLAAHVYKPGDASQFSFSAPAKDYTACGFTFKPSMGGTLISYRDAGHDFPNYNAQGYGSTASADTFTFGPIAASQINSGSPPEGTMMLQLALTSAGSGTGGTEITSFTGSPSLNFESADGINDGPFYNGQMSFGPYTTTSNCVPSNKEYCGFLNLALGIPGY
jgi:hypothetical protein